MATAVIMPRQGQSVESCIITSWSKKVGDKVAKGDVLFSYETDKSAFDEVSEVEGTVLKILAEEGDDVPCLDVVCIIGAEGEDISALLGGASASAATQAAPAESEKPISPAAAAEIVSTAGENDGERIKISPRAKNLAVRTDADLSRVTPTGPEGRIIERDIVRSARRRLYRFSRGNGSLFKGRKIRRRSKGRRSSGRTGSGGRCRRTGSIRNGLYRREAAADPPRHRQVDARFPFRNGAAHAQRIL